MAKEACSDSDFIKLVETFGIGGTARKLGISDRSVFSRRKRLEERGGFSIAPPNWRALNEQHDARLHIKVKDGCVLVGSDAHYWPEIVTTAHRAFIKFIRDLKPKAVILNGDIMDGASVSRHPPIGWEKNPTLIEEIDACKARLFEIEKVSKGAKKIWTLGNHDARFSTRLATVAPEYARVNGTRLVDHFPDWEPCWSVWIDDQTVVKHRFKSGIHAPWNNTMWAGKSIVTGHLHSQKVYPLSDYNGTRWGVDCGTLAEPTGPQFRNYTEDAPLNWRSGFCVLTFWKGRMLTPELVRVVGDGQVEWRGKVVEV